MEEGKQSLANVPRKGPEAFMGSTEAGSARPQDKSAGAQTAETSVDHRQVELNLVAGSSRTGTEDCQFWVGLTCAGQLSPNALMDAPDLDALFKRAASEGLCESGPVMLTDAGDDGARYIYLLHAPGKEFRDRAIWMHDLVATVRAWAPNQVGFYIAPTLLTAAAGYELLIQTISELIRSTSTNQFYLLVGEHGLNPIVNAAVKMKHEIEELTAANGHNIELFIQH